MRPLEANLIMPFSANNGKEPQNLVIMVTGNKECFASNHLPKHFLDTISLILLIWLWFSEIINSPLVILLDPFSILCLLFNPGALGSSIHPGDGLQDWALISPTFYALCQCQNGGLARVLNVFIFHISHHQNTLV